MRDLKTLLLIFTASFTLSVFWQAYQGLPVTIHNHPHDGVVPITSNIEVEDE